MSYSETDIKAIVDAQRAFFRSGATLDIRWRIGRLRELRDAVLANEEAFEQALAADLGRSSVEAYLCDIGPLVVEINEMIRGLRKWARPERHFSGLMCFPSIVTKVFKMPYGVTLVISPFNFPILLTLGVVAASLCGGNTVVIKASAKSTHCRHAWSCSPAASKSSFANSRSFIPCSFSYTCTSSAHIYKALATSRPVLASCIRSLKRFNGSRN